MIYGFIAMIESPQDRSLAEQLYWDNRDVVYRLAWSFFKDEHRAEDAVCDVFERVCKNIFQFRGLDCNKSTALIVVYSRNLFIDAFRRDQRIRFDTLEEGYVSPREDTEEAVLNQESFGRLLGAVRSLDEKYSQVCTLKYYIGLSDGEIAHTLGITPENVRVRLHRSRQMLRSQLDKEELEV